MQFEKLIFWIATSAFILHFILLLLAQQELIPSHWYNYRAVHPISSIYTPFSVILLYEIYVLIYYLPKSISIYLGKQYEVIVLILVRKIFEELGNLSIAVNTSSFSLDAVRELVLSFIGFIILFLLVLLFYRLSGGNGDCTEYKEQKMKVYITSKKAFSLLLLLLFVVLFIKSLFDMQYHSLSVEGGVYILKKINQIFFDTFFSALILIEVLLLLLSLNLSDRFSKVVRNSGFIISTILLKMSFMIDGLLNIVLSLLAVLFGVAIVAVYNLYEKWLGDGK